MFLSTTSIRPFVQNENPDNTGFKKPGASKTGGLSLRTPFKDRSVNSVSPTSKYNSKVQMQKKSSETPVVKNTEKTVTSLKFQPMEEDDDIFMNDYASYEDVDYGYADVFPSQRLDIVQILRNFVSGGQSPKFIHEDDSGDEPMELPISNLELRCSPLPTQDYIHDVPLPVFNF